MQLQIKHIGRTPIMSKYDFFCLAKLGTISLISHTLIIVPAGKDIYKMCI